MACVSSSSCDCSIMAFIQKHQKLNDLVHWRRPLESAGFFVLGLGYLISLATLSFISVVAYTCLALLCCTGGYRLYSEVIGKRKKAVDGSATDAQDKAATAVAKENLFEKWLSNDFSLPKEKLVEGFAKGVDYATVKANRLRKILMFENYSETLLFAIVAYIVAKVGACINVLVLATLGFVAVFTLPKVYELYQPQIDKAIAQMKVYLKQSRDVVMMKLQTIPVIGSKLKTS